MVKIGFRNPTPQNIVGQENLAENQGDQIPLQGQQAFPEEQQGPLQGWQAPPEEQQGPLQGLQAPQDQQGLVQEQGALQGWQAPPQGQQGPPPVQEENRPAAAAQLLGSIRNFLAPLRFRLPIHDPWCLRCYLKVGLGIFLMVVLGALIYVIVNFARALENIATNNNTNSTDGTGNNYDNSTL